MGPPFATIRLVEPRATVANLTGSITLDRTKISGTSPTKETKQQDKPTSNSSTSYVTFQAKTSTQTFLPGKTTEVHRDVPKGFLGYGFLFSGFSRKSQEVPVSLPRKLEIYRDIAMLPGNSPVYDR